MTTIHKKYLLAAAVTFAAAMAAAQPLNSAYFTQDFKYRHDLNPAFDNDQNYFSFPALGNLNVKMQGNFGLQDVLFQDPLTGKYNRTFMHPDVTTADALSGFQDNNRIQADINETLLSAGFRAFGGYNTIELSSRTMVGLQLPYELLEFAKNVSNKNYEFGTIGLRAQSYAELALGHSHQLSDALRFGAKLKVLLGVGRADVSISGMRANFVGDTWQLTSGDVTADVNVKGLTFVNTEDEYKQDGRGTYEHIDLGETDVDGFGLNGFGLGVDLGAEYSFKNSSSKALRTLKISAALTDLGFISWSNDIQLAQKSTTFTFDGFHETPVKSHDENGNPYVLGTQNGKVTGPVEDQADRYVDQLSDFVALQNLGDQGGQTTGLAATANLGVEYALPSYEKLSFGLLGQHHFIGDYSWTEGRLSVNWAPASWLDGGVSLAVNTFATSMGWVLNLHPAGINIFLGMDHILGTQSKELIPLSSNASFNLGVNIAWGKSAKDKRPSKYRKLL